MSSIRQLLCLAGQTQQEELNAFASRPWFRADEVRSLCPHSGILCHMECRVRPHLQLHVLTLRELALQFTLMFRERVADLDLVRLCRGFQRV